MANFTVTIESSPRNDNFILIRHRDGKTRLPNGRLKKFLDYRIEKTERMNIDGKVMSGKQLANALAEKVKARYYSGEMGVSYSSDSLEELVEAYFDDKKQILPKTRINYEDSLKKMIIQFRSLDNLSREKMIAWREQLKKDSYENNTIHGILNNTRMFCNWLVYKKKLGLSPFKKENPQDKGIIPSKTKARPRFYSLEEFFKLEKEVMAKNHYAHLACRLSHDYGLRKVEMVGDGIDRFEGVLWEDLIWRPDGKVDLFIRPEVTKGRKKSRRLPLDDSFIQLLGSRKTGPICPISVWQLNYIIGTAMKRAKITKMPGLFIHSFRHSFGKNFLQLSGGNQPALRDLLGHEDTKTTDIYSQFEPSYLDASMTRMQERVNLEKSRIQLAGQREDISIEIDEIKDNQMVADDAK